MLLNIVNSEFVKIYALGYRYLEVLLEKPDIKSTFRMGLINHICRI